MVKLNSRRYPGKLTIFQRSFGNDSKLFMSENLMISANLGGNKGLVSMICFWYEMKIRAIDVQNVQSTSEIDSSKLTVPPGFF